MANIARLPCDEAVILAGSCEGPATTTGPWILAATILGSSRAFINGTVVTVARPPQDLCCRHCSLLGSLGLVRTGSQHPTAYCRKRPPRNRWRAPCTRQPGS